MAKEIDYSKIGLRISSLRKKAGLTQEVLAARCGCTSNHLSNVEVGKCKPSLDLIIRLAMELNSSVDYFLLGHLMRVANIYSTLRLVQSWIIVLLRNSST